MSPPPPRAIRPSSEPAVLWAPTVVTTAERPDARLVARAHAVAQRCGLPYQPRNGSMPRTTGGRAAYVVRRERDEIWTPTARMHVHAGLTRARHAAGHGHPLIRALAPKGTTVRRIADGTLGLGQDALHVAATLGAEIMGCELSPIVFSLLEEGLPRLAAEDGIVATAARRISPHMGDSATLFAAQEPDSFDAVLVSPMFVQPDRAEPGYQAFRDAAVHAPLSTETVEQAFRIAPRLVVKARPGEPTPPSLEGRSREVLRGRALEYWVFHRRG